MLVTLDTADPTASSPCPTVSAMMSSSAARPFMIPSLHRRVSSGENFKSVANTGRTSRWSLCPGISRSFTTTFLRYTRSSALAPSFLPRIASSSPRSETISAAAAFRSDSSEVTRMVASARAAAFDAFASRSFFAD